MCGFSKAIPIALEGSGKDAQGWFPLEQAQVYHDHFIKAQLEGGVVLDFLSSDRGSPVRLCLELSADSARALAQALLDTVANIPGEQIEAMPGGECQVRA